VVAVVGRHWQPVFAEKAISEADARAFVNRWARRFPDATWELTFDAFEDMIRRTSDSGCGPDGIPYSAWKHASKFVRRIVYQWYLAWLHGYKLADDANHAFLALIPKQAEPDDHIHGTYWMPKNLRPLSLSNTDVKLLALALNAVVAPVLPHWARPEQRGFINDRLILQNVVDVESCALAASLRTSLDDPGLRLSNPAAIFFDFGVAFPSLAQLFLWILLSATSFPDAIVAAIRELIVTIIIFGASVAPPGSDSRSSLASSRSAPSARPCSSWPWTLSLPPSRTPWVLEAASGCTPMTLRSSSGTSSFRPPPLTSYSTSLPASRLFVSATTNASSCRCGPRT